MSETSGCDPQAVIRAMRDKGVPRTRVINVRDNLTQADREYVFIGRGSKWGNPFTHLYSHAAVREGLTIVSSREEAIAEYESYLKSSPDLMAAVPALRGKTLGCFCKPLACHGDVLARLADES